MITFALIRLLSRKQIQTARSEDGRTPLANFSGLPNCRILDSDPDAVLTRQTRCCQFREERSDEVLRPEIYAREAGKAKISVDPEM